MNDKELDRLLAIGREKNSTSPEVLDAVLARLSDGAKAKALAPKTRSPRRWVLISVSTLAVGIAATAGAFYFAPSFTPDAVIPIVYTTDTGRQIECTYSLAVNAWDGVDASEARRWVAQHDWSGIGQRGYDYAIAHPIEPGTAGVDPAIPQDELDRSAVSRGISTVIVQEIPEGFLVGPGVGTVGTSTCRWERH
ncbi:MAG: hypothetical protein J0I43_02620 [Microbacterium sp.]|uniref:hypothetical protein n=1 Tax=Microbacterium sp. TaxID=51671 RepID=UPI001AC275FE|nr:hypothetical protein [Microbacterium sp.]MBN9176251.1 hypothetical protein [Microbacterium sp.]